MKIQKKEYASLCDGKLQKTVHIILEPEDEEDKKIIIKKGNDIYL